MENSEIIDLQYPKKKQPGTGQKVVLIIGILLRIAGFVILGGVIAIFVTSYFFHLDLKQIFSENGLPLDNKQFIISLQGFTQLFSFIILPALYINFFKKDLTIALRPKWKDFGTFSLLAILIMLFGMPLIHLLIEWNSNIHLPSFLHKVEVWMQGEEERAKKLTELIAYYNSNQEFIIGMIVIAILPAFGEEFLFRGIVQNELKEITLNPHFAIWMSGFIFSFLHFQFYGFFPRMMLGVTFGYMYYWSGSLLIPILVHFLNNGLTFILLNLYRNKRISLDPESSEIFPLYSIIISSIIFLFLLLTFKKLANKTED